MYETVSDEDDDDDDDDLYIDTAKKTKKEFEKAGFPIFGIQQHSKKVIVDIV